MMSAKPQEGDSLAFVEVDPTGRYGRYSEILGKGASKTVYRAFDEYEGMEVAWNQVKLHDFLQSPQDLERLYCEIHLLKTLKHKNIMKLYASWIDTSNRNINFITEMFTSGTLRQYRLRHRRVNIRAVKNWCRQILMGLAYLHSHDPPVIHRDLKCDNIFINGNQGEVKIGDLGLAAILRKSQAVHCVGTPEFMAPEVYEEEYNELVDIYSFGMCVLEMVTFDYPYSECTHPAQIYKKVVSGTKPEALYRVEDPEVRQFVEKCLVSASHRLPAWQLLKDPFLHVDGLSHVVSNEDTEMRHLLKQPFISPQENNGSQIANSLTGAICEYTDDELEIHGMNLFNSQEDEHFGDVDIAIKGRRKEDGEVLFRVRITDKDGHVRNIYFPFDVKADTALGVAAEMVTELDIIDCEVTRIAEMIDGELSLLINGWKACPGINESPGLPSKVLCHNCASNASSYGSLLDFLSSRGKDPQPFYCSNVECAAMHGRFEEITYQGAATGESEISVSNSDVFDPCVDASERIFSHEDGDHLCYYDQEEEINDKAVEIDHQDASSEGAEQKIEYNEMNLIYQRGALHSLPNHTNQDKQVEDWKKDHHLFHRSLRTPKGRTMKSFHLSNKCNFRVPSDTEATDSKFRSFFRNFNTEGSTDPMVALKSFYAGNIIPSSILRTKSLPVDNI